MISIEAVTLCDLIDDLKQQGELPALISTAGPEPVSLSRQALLDQAQRVATALRQAPTGLGKGDVVALLAENRFEWITAALAVIRAGAIVLPIDSQTGDRNLKHLLEDSGTTLIFTNAEHEPRLKELSLEQPPRLIRLDDSEEDSDWQRMLATPAGSLPEPEPSDDAVLFYTSGTTGPPKGVPLSHANLVFEIRTIVAADLITADDRLLLPLPLHHVYPFVMSMLAPIGARLPIVLPKAMTGPEILRAIGEGGVTVVIGVPRLYRALYAGILGQVEQRGALGRAVFHASLAVSHFARQRLGLSIGKTLLRPLHRKFGESLRLMASGGSALDPQLQASLEALGWQVGIGYGLTETSPLLTLKMPDRGPSGTVGRAIEGVELRIRPLEQDPEEAGPEREEPPGEVQARGPNIFRGYLHLEDKTREAFTEDGWYRTGDLGHLDDDGWLFLQGRASTLIVTESGKNVQPDEVEDHYALHPAIAEIGVLEDQGRLVALIVADADGVRKSGRAEADAIRDAVSEQGRKLPSYQRLADFVVTRESLPRTRLGKVQRHLLKEQYRQAGEARESGPRHHPGLMPAEEMSDQDHALLEDSNARQVWQWLGHRYPDRRITPDTSLQFDLNIDSLEMLNLTMDIAQTIQVELDEQSLARVDSVRDLLLEVSRGGGSGKTLDPERIVNHPEDYLSAEQSRYLRPFNPLESGLALLGRGLAWLVMKTYFRLEVQGQENLPRDGVFLLTPNHVSVLDPIALFAATPPRVLRDTYFAGWTGMVFKNAFMRFGGRVGKTVPIDPERAAASSLALGAMVLKQGNNLIWFPEGERSASGALQSFKPGVGMLLKHQPVQVVPIAIIGAEAAMPVGRRLPLPRPIKVIFGQPVSTAELVDPDSEEPAQDQIRQGLHERVKQLLPETD